MPELIVGIDLGGTNLKTALVSRDRRLLARDSRPTQGESGPDAVIETAETAVRAVLQKAGRSIDDVAAAGFGAPGPLNWREGIVYSLTNLPGWDNVPLAAKMQERLGVPCFVDNDANVACYGEFWMGAGQGCDIMAVLTLGTGVGGGIVVFGRLLRGPDGTAAELGHLVLQRDGRPSGSPVNGSLEAYASVTGLVRTAVEALEAGGESVLRERSGGDLGAITGAMISEAANEGDEFARWAIRETGIWIGLGCVSLVHTLNPEKIVLCGGMIAAGDLLFDPVRETMKKNTFKVPGERCQIVPAGLGTDAGVLGAAGCALARIEDTSQG